MAAVAQVHPPIASRFCVTMTSTGSLTGACLPLGEEVTQCKFSVDDLIVVGQSNLGQTCMCKTGRLAATMDIPSGENVTAAIGGGCDIRKQKTAS